MLICRIKNKDIKKNERNQMIYGAIFLKHNRLSVQKQHDGINAFARKNNLKYETEILSMYASGDSMYQIARKLNLTDPAVKRCLVANNVKGA